MDQIFWAERPTLVGLHPSDAKAVALRHALVAKVPHALKPLKEYLAILKPYESWLQPRPALTADLRTVRPSSLAHFSAEN